MEVFSPPNVLQPFSVMQRTTPGHLNTIARGLNRMNAGVYPPMADIGQFDNLYSGQWLMVLGTDQRNIYCLQNWQYLSDKEIESVTNTVMVVAKPTTLSPAGDILGLGYTLTYKYDGSGTVPTEDGQDDYSAWSPDGNSRYVTPSVDGLPYTAVLNRLYYTGDLILALPLPTPSYNIVAGSYYCINSEGEVGHAVATYAIPDGLVGSLVVYIDANIDGRAWVQQGGGGAGIAAAVITAVNTNGTLTCTSTGKTITVQMAPVMTNSTASRVAFGHTITYTYSNVQTRTATWGGTNTETEVIVPMINVGETIYVAKVGANYQDLNLAAHAWAKQ